MPPSDQDIRNRLLVTRLPALPHILLKLMEYCQTEDVGMAELAALIAKDPAIATKILGVANSTAYHRGGHKVGLELSLMSLGTDMIRTLVISESVFQTFSNFATSSNINLCGFWKHSLSAAVIARDLAKKIGYSNIDEAYLGGLLHDVGRLAFLAISPNEYAPIFHSIDDDALCAAEQRTMQISHPEAGAWMIERWKLNSALADSVLYHHESAERMETALPLIRIVFLAHRLSCRPFNDPDTAQVATMCGLNLRDLEILQIESIAKIQESADFLGIDLSDADYVPPQSVPVQQSPVQQRLNEELSNMVQASETERTFARPSSEPELLETVTRSARILFHLDDAIILTMDAEIKNLVANPDSEHTKRLSGFSISLASGGAVAESAIQMRPAFISGKSHPIAEEPLLRILGTESLVSVPLARAGKCLGVMIGGASSAKISALKQNAKFLQVFSVQAAAALLLLRNKQAIAENHAANVAEGFRLSSRKVAHEVNNPLSIIKNYLNLLNYKLQNQEPVSSEMTVLHEEIDRVSRIIGQFSDPQPEAPPSRIDVNKVVMDVVRLFRDTGFAPGSVNILASTESKPSEAECNDGLIRQIFMNLLKNAVEAMPDGGDITIKNNGHVDRDGHQYIGLSIEDTGPGIPGEILEKLFFPVTSSKGGMHQGLGLSIVHDLVKKLNGQIACRSNKSGTSFDILLPVRGRNGGNTSQL